MTYNWTNNTILVAEDDPINFKYLQLLLEKKTKCNILWAKNGRQAYNKIVNNTEIDMVLLDLQLPEMNGLKVLTEVRIVNHQIPIIMQTANSWNNEEEECILAGCNGFYTKPLNIDALFKHMNDCIKKYTAIKSTSELL